MIRNFIRTIAVASLFVASAGCQRPNLVAVGMDVTWDDTTRTVKAYVRNTGTVDSGEFRVYVDADEQPESQRDRPQAGGHFTSLAPDATIEIDANFAPLASNYNFNLGHVRSITLRVDPKNEIDESNEQDNVLTTHLPSAVGAVTIYGAVLRPFGYVVVSPERVGQTFTPPASGRLVAIEVTASRCSASATDTLTLKVRQGTTELGAVALSGASFPHNCNNTLAPISGQSPGPQLFTFSQPIPLTAGSEYSVEFTSSGGTFHVGWYEDMTDTGTATADDHPLALGDLALKWHMAP